uniref:Uncharacterized protein n=1 Tax=Neogobius melanostomus TaxID=47308 RepID=A0A8C6SM14_9GOBI
MCERAAEEQIQRLQCQLRETEEQLQKAAQAGLGLLDQQTELQEKLDEQRIEMTKALEVICVYFVSEILLPTTCITLYCRSVNKKITHLRKMLS